MYAFLLWLCLCQFNLQIQPETLREPRKRFSSPKNACDKVKCCFVNSHFCYLCVCEEGHDGFLFFDFLGPHLQHMEVCRLGVQSELQLPAYTTVCSNARSKPCLWPIPQLMAVQIPDPLSDAGDWTLILMDSSWIRFCCIMKGTPHDGFLNVAHGPNVWEAEGIRQTNVLCTGWSWFKFIILV